MASSLLLFVSFAAGLGMVFLLSFIDHADAARLGTKSVDSSKRLYKTNHFEATDDLTETPATAQVEDALAAGGNDDDEEEGRNYGSGVVDLVNAGEETEEDEADKELISDYNLGTPIVHWDRKRRQWAEEHPEVKQEELFILTGTQPWPCKNAEGDHLLLRCFKNKVDYSRIQGIGLFYNAALLDPHMPSFWAKLPVVRATMLAHPEVEWIWWLDADAIVTDMEFRIPLERYANYSMVVLGWERLIYEKPSWVGLNAGSFLLRNCQWALDLLERWASMGPQAPMGDALADILSDFLPGRPRLPTEDQGALVYLLNREPHRWAGKLRVELDFLLSGYWVEFMDSFEATEKRYARLERQRGQALVALLEREGAVGKEKLLPAMARAREQQLTGMTVQERRPFITHFTGCQPCSGHHNSIYSGEKCRDGMVRALNFADNQVLRTLGYSHRSLLLPDVHHLSAAV